MATNLALDHELLEEALKNSDKKTKKAVVTDALIEYIQRRKQAKLLDLFGHIDIDPNYDYKEQRIKK
ncbi:MAG: type II toxin-antitoxin system VapB family antitoxin [Candidatus Marinimicrobia bacterium]|jgi:Arc/MetJ family transcription regulator|nr:type II toxin-antitoxin system VapB family antitoxin [Candidatus Neomarinimicrobiota bacterium]MBT3677079.1 type II toxin-antitoxin system VapB family antitoxin [Candidatus Neomarinimicrobiota bacterium]MBT4069488.1 type II toxin-antitoxin system VapB family antitoxin [Candidatus Neomarinimicrobiota bacterium]MBT4270518.1 type II toxin-antitoxin system VapB family antitoxin [Candidatus Neomarinimicrobiota bacterium]MBT4372675.1 type II toxin-antitoxin system VapB family antitoxin [Candidatus